ncbi:MAG TPA: hypothetical protein VLZ12_05845 [Verrucomicrobiae bacterium]|nr:hypothetical protein [Verrucomicrobiae bacterium]
MKVPSKLLVLPESAPFPRTQQQELRLILWAALPLRQARVVAVRAMDSGRALQFVRCRLERPAQTSRVLARWTVEAAAPLTALSRGSGS